MNNDKQAPKHDISCDKCKECGASEIPAMTPRTVYKCGSSDYDRRPGTFKQSENCIANMMAATGCC